MSYEFVREAGVELTVIKTSPNNIKLRKIDQNVASSPYYGINGGFYYQGQQLSIAVNDDVPIQGNPSGYGSGWFNHKYDRGTLVWDKVARRYSIQVVGSVDDIEVTDRSAYWAQGGISMGLQNDYWEVTAKAENMPRMNDKVFRSGLVYNTGLNIWLVITKTPCTARAFRHAIKGQLGNGTIVDGIFLDGSGSTQMKTKEESFSGDGRRIFQMISLT